MQQYFNSEFRGIQSLRRQHPFPLVEISYETAGKHDIHNGDWVWIESPRGRIKQKAKLTDQDPRIIHVSYGWWYPEMPGPEYGVWESNANVLTNDEPPHCPALGTYQLTGMLCKISKVGENEETPESYYKKWEKNVMITEKTRETILKLADKYPHKNSAIIPVLHLVQDENHQFLSKEDIGEISKILKLPIGKIHSTASFYSMFNLNKTVGQYHLMVDTNISATLMGSLKIVEYLEEKLKIKRGETTSDDMFTLSTVEDLASSGSCPVILVNNTYFENMTIEKTGDLNRELKKRGNAKSRKRATFCIHLSRALEKYWKKGADEH